MPQPVPSADEFLELQNRVRELETYVLRLGRRVSRGKSKNLLPGTDVRHVGGGRTVTLDRRKGPGESWYLPGWWVEGGGGIADLVLDAPNSVWEVVQ